MDLAQQLQKCYKTYSGGNFNLAEQQFGQIDRQFSKNADALHLGALIAFGLGQNTVALKRAELALSLSPKHYECWNTKGSIFAKQQNVPAAFTSYRKSLELKPDYLQAALNYGSCLIDNDDMATAIDVYEKARQFHPKNEQLLIGQVIALNETGRSQEALEIIKSVEGEEKYAYLKGQIYLNLGEFDKLIEVNKIALRQPNSAGPALKNMLQAYWMSGDWDAGEHALKSAIDDKDATLDVFLAASHALRRAGELQKASDTLDKAVRQFSDSPAILVEKARMAMDAGQADKAWENALAALTAKPGDLAIMEVFAQSALMNGRPNEAMVAAESALNIVPNNQFWIAIKYTAGRAMGQNYKFYADVEKQVKTYQLDPGDKYASLDVFNTRLKQSLERIHNFKQHPLDQSLRNGSQTLKDLRYSRDEVIQDFFNAVDGPINSYIDEIGNNISHPLDNRNTGKYRLAGAWSVLLRAGGHHVNHLHPKGWLSSSYYVDVPAEVDDEENKAGWIQFGQPPFLIKDQNGNALGPEKFIKPEPGTLVLFPSYLWHGTVPITGTSTRLTLPFDAVPA